MPTLRFALAQFDFPVGAVPRNGERVRELIDEARDTYGAQLIAFPELSLSGLSARRSAAAAEFSRRLRARSRRQSRRPPVASPPTSVIRTRWVKYTMQQVSLVDGEVSFTTHKQALPNYTVFDEKRYFRSGNHSAVTDFAGVRVGWLVCEDIWEQEPAAHAAAQGAELLIVINASPFDVGKSAQRAELLSQRARENERGDRVCESRRRSGRSGVRRRFAAGRTRRSHRCASAVVVDALLIAEYDSRTRRFSTVEWPDERRIA